MVKLNFICIFLMVNCPFIYLLGFKCNFRPMFALFIMYFNHAKIIDCFETNCVPATERKSRGNRRHFVISPEMWSNFFRSTWYQFTYKTYPIETSRITDIGKLYATSVSNIRHCVFQHEQVMFREEKSLSFYLLFQTNFSLESFYQTFILFSRNLLVYSLNQVIFICWGRKG